MHYIFISLVFSLGFIFAQGITSQDYSGNYQNAEGTGLIVLQQNPDGSLQGSFSGVSGQMQIQGYVDQEGAYGNLLGQQGKLAFQAQLSPDGTALQFLVAPYGQDGQVDVSAVQELSYRRVVTANPNPGPEPIPASPGSVPASLPNPLAPAPSPAALNQQGFLEAFDSPGGEFASYVLKGQEDVWSGQLLSGHYQLGNSSNTGSIKYIYATALTGVTSPLSNNAISVDIMGKFSHPEYSQAGLIFHFDPQTRFYYAFLIKAGTMLSLVLRDADGFQELASTSSDALRAGQINRLMVVPEGEVLRFFVNGSSVMSIESPSLAPGGAGIIAVGTGDFIFDDFAVTNTKP